MIYIPTRYPNGLPELTPAEAYQDEDAQQCILQATEILAAVKSILPGNDEDTTKLGNPGDSAD